MLAPPYLDDSGIEEWPSTDHLVHVQECLHLPVDGLQLLLPEINATHQHLGFTPGSGGEE